MVNGLPLHEAYRRAGYKSRSASAPYELKRYLKNELLVAMNSAGISEESLLIETRRLMNIPLDPNVDNLSFNQKLKVINTMHKILPKDHEKKQMISPVIIQRGEGPTQINIGNEEKKSKEVEKDAS